MDDELIDITREEPKETDSILEDYLKGLNEGIGKLMEKEKTSKGSNAKEVNARENKKDKKEDGNECLVLLIEETNMDIENKNEKDLAKKTEKTSDGIEEYGAFQSNTQGHSKEIKNGEQNKRKINEQKMEIKKFIENMDELNEKMDKLLENDNKEKLNTQVKQAIRKQKKVTKIQDKNVKTDETIELLDIGNDHNVIQNIREDVNKENTKYIKDNIPEGKDNSNNIKTETVADLNELPSNLTVVEQTYTLEENHRRFERKVKKEIKTLEEIDLDEMAMHGVHECNAELHEEQYSVPYEYQNYMGMTVTSGIVTIQKDNSNLIGISIGGGAPLCPCLYIVQVFDNTPAAKEGTLQSGDEVVGVNGMCVKGKTKVEVAKMIQSVESEVSIKYNKLHADPQQGKSLDIILKKVKHRLVENMSTTTADALGLSRAILCNDTLVKKMEELENTEQMYKGLVDHCKKVLKGFLALLRVYKDFGDAFAGIGVREPQPRASEAFRQFGEYHRTMEKNGIATIKSVKPILSDLGTYLNKAIPDTKLTIRKYADTKFEYLSYCLKVKEMDDEEYSYAALQEPLYRVETGNYEYRLILRCRQDARLRFAALRSDVLVKLELLDNKHVQDVVCQLQRLIAGLASYHSTNIGLLRENSLFPIEMDLSQNSFQYECSQVPSYENNDDDDEEQGVDGKVEDLVLGEEVKPDNEIEEPHNQSSEYADLLRELDDNDNTNLLDL